MARVALGAVVVAMICPAVIEAKEDPVTQLQRTQQQLKDLLVPGPHGWQMIRDLDTYRRLTRQVARLKRLLRPPHFSAWLCIHRGEGAWNDPNPPYYGGLQMDYGFQSTYGPELLRRKGTADHWTPLDQMWVAERAYRSGRGFYPWPNTARNCGLI